MSFNDLLRLLRRHRVLAILTALLVLAAGAFVAFRTPDRYSSTATITVDPNIGPDGQVDSVSNIDFFVPQFLALLSSRKLTDAAGSGLPPDVQNANISVGTGADPGTGILRITVTSTDRNAVAPWAAAYAKALISATGNKLATLTLIDEPTTPTAPYAPNRTFVLIITLLIALSAAIVAVVLAAALRVRRDATAEIRDRFGVRVLAEIPTLRRSVATLDPENLAENPRAVPAVDALQTLRAGLAYLLTGRQHRHVAVVSAKKREGKSFVAVHLAWLLAGLGDETMLLDANSRHPTAHQLLGLSPSPGIERLTDSNLGAVVQRTAREHLAFIAASRPGRHPAEIASSHFPLLLKQIEGHDVTLIVDTPAMTGAAETVIFAAGCGAVLLVIDARRRDLSDVEQLLLTFEDRGIDVLGVVINRRSSWRQRITGPQSGGRARRGRSEAIVTPAPSPNGRKTPSGPRPAETPAPPDSKSA